MAIKDYNGAQKLTGFSSRERPLGDFYATPPIALEKLLSVEKYGNSVWEPCCGNGAISSILEQKGFDVYSSDLHDWGYGDCGKDFLQEPDRDVDAVITNPPFNLSYDFAVKALKTTKNKNGKVAMLNRLAWLEGVKRQALFHSTPLSKVLVFSRRLPRMHRYDYTGKPGTSMLCFAWFCWDHTHTGETTISWI